MHLPSCRIGGISLAVYVLMGSNLSAGPHTFLWCEMQTNTVIVTREHQFTPKKVAGSPVVVSAGRAQKAQDFLPSHGRQRRTHHCWQCDPENECATIGTRCGRGEGGYKQGEAEVAHGRTVCGWPGGSPSPHPAWPVAQMVTRQGCKKLSLFWTRMHRKATEYGAPDVNPRKAYGCMISLLFVFGSLLCIRPFLSITQVCASTSTEWLPQRRQVEASRSLTASRWVKKS